MGFLGSSGMRLSRSSSIATDALSRAGSQDSQPRRVSYSPPPPAEPTQQQLDKFREDILRHGPLPEGCSAEPLNNDEILYILPDDEASQHHPLSPFCEMEKTFASVWERQSSIGVEHPKAYQPGQWRWTPAESMPRAVAHAAELMDRHSADDVGHPRVTTEESAVKYFERNVAATGKLATTIYHPDDQDSQPVPNEPEASWFARALNVSLVLVVFDIGNPRDYFNHSQQVMPVVTRWSIGTYIELAPPIYVGYGLGKWFSLVPVDLSWYDQFSIAENNWTTMYQQMAQKYGMLLTEEGFIRVAIRLQRLIRAGYQAHRSSMDALYQAYVASQISGERERDALLRIRDIPPEPNPIISYDRINNALACSGLDFAREEAKKLDRALVIKNTYDITEPIYAQSLRAIKLNVRSLRLPPPQSSQRNSCSQLGAVAPTETPLEHAELNSPPQDQTIVTNEQEEAVATTTCNATPADAMDSTAATSPHSVQHEPPIKRAQASSAGIATSPQGEVVQTSQAFVTRFIQRKPALNRSTITSRATTSSSKALAPHLRAQQKEQAASSSTTPTSGMSVQDAARPKIVPPHLRRAMEAQNCKQESSPTPVHSQSSVTDNTSLKEAVEEVAVSKDGVGNGRGEAVSDLLPTHQAPSQSIGRQIVLHLSAPREVCGGFPSQVTLTVGDGRIITSDPPLSPMVHEAVSHYLAKKQIT